MRPFSVGVFGSALLFAAALRTSAEEPGKKFDSYKVIPPKASFEVTSMKPSYCGRQTSLYVFQIKVDDIYHATKQTADLLEKISAESPGDSCKFFASWPTGVDDRDRQIRVTRWIKESDLNLLSAHILKLGTPQYVNEIPDQGQFGPSILKELTDLREKAKSDSPIAKDPARKKAVDDQIQELERSAASYQATKEKILVHIFLVQPHKPRNNPVPGPQVAPNIEKRSFSSLKPELRSPEVAVRRAASAALFSFVTESRKLSASVGGVGLQLGTNAQGVVVAGIIKDMPAEKSGIIIGDIIVAVNDTPTAGKSIDVVSSLIRGPVGTKVTLAVRTPDQPKGRSISFRRKTLLPTQGEIQALAEDCVSDSDAFVRIRCLAAASATGDPKNAGRAEAKLSNMLSQSDKTARNESFNALGDVWGLSARPEPAPTEPQRVSYVQVSPQASAACAGSKEPCTPMATTTCLVMTSKDSLSGIWTMELKGPKGSSVATFPCKMDIAAHDALYGPFCGLAPGNYLETIRNCAGTSGSGRIGVYPGEWALNLCLAQPGHVNCRRSPDGLSPAVLKMAGLAIRMDVSLSSSSIQGVSKDSLCSQIPWSLGGNCVWLSAHAFFREAKFTPARTTEFSIQSHVKNEDVLEKLSVSARLDNSPATAQIQDIYVAPGQWASGKIEVPEAGQEFPVRSADGIVDIRPQIAGISVTPEPFSATAVKAYLRKIITPSTQAAYRVRGSEFVFTQPAPISFSYPGAQTGEALIIYSFDGYEWSSDAVTEQKVKKDAKSGRITVSGKFARSGLYATFSLGRDLTPPITSFSIVGSSRVSDGLLLVSTDAFVALKAIDPSVNGFASQVATTYYRIDRFPESDLFSIYVTSIPLPIGPHVIEYRSQDWAGNMEAVKVTSFVVTAGDVVQSANDHAVARKLLIGFLDYGAETEVQSQAQNDYTFMVSGPTGNTLLGVNNIGAIGLGVPLPQALLDIGPGVPISLQLRNGISPRGAAKPQISFGWNGSDEMRHEISTRHGPGLADNRVDFSLWTPALSTGAAADLRVLSLEGASSPAKASFHVCPIGSPTAELEVSNGRTMGGGSVRRLEAQVLVSTTTDAGSLTDQEALRKRAYQDVISLKQALYHEKTDRGASELKGLVYEDAPASIRGNQGEVLLDTRVSELELALQEAIVKLERLEMRLKALQDKKR